MAAQITPTANTILSSDFGSVNTRTVLFGMVDGQFRLVSRGQSLSTSSPPILDASVGLRRTLDQMSALIGRTFLDSKEELIIGEGGTNGADLFLATASGGKPMKAVLVGLTSDVSLASGQRALASTYVDLAEIVSLVDLRSTEDQVNAILNSRPDVIFIVGGIDYGAHEAVKTLLETIKLAVLLAQAKPVVLYAGNLELKPLVEEMLGSEATLFTTANVRPTVNEEKLGPAQLELSLVYGAYKANNPGGFGDVQKLSKLGLMPTAQSYSNVIRYLGELPGAGIGVICVDVGSSTVTVAASIKKQAYLTIRPDLGLGHSAVSSVQKVGTKNIQRWLTFEASESEIMDYAWNKTLRPSTVPQTARDLEMEYAIMRELLRCAVSEARIGWRGIPYGETLPGFRPIIGVGSVLTQALDPGISALLLLDSLQPTGISEIQLDPYGVMAALGGVAYLEPLAMVQILESGGLYSLGTAISPNGRPQGSTAMDVTVKMPDGNVIHEKVGAGSLKLIPLPTGQKAQVTIKLGRGLHLNGRSRVTAMLEGGAAGLIFDGRGRPLNIPKSLDIRADTIPLWYGAVRAT